MMVQISQEAPASAAALPAVIAVSDIDTEINSVPRIKDLFVAEKLGMARPTNIRRVIEGNRTELEAYGPLHAASAMVGIGSGAQREAMEYWLNEGQALCVCALSRAPNAAAVRRALIEAFMELRRRELAASVPHHYPPSARTPAGSPSRSPLPRKPISPASSGSAPWS